MITVPFDSSTLPWEEPKRQSNLSEDVVNRTVHHVEWLTVLVDEGHKFRSQPWIASHFRHKSCIFLTATATPLYTRPMDLVNLGYMLGIAQICCDEFQLSYKSLDSSCSRAKRRLNRVSKSQIATGLDDEDKRIALREHSDDVEMAMKEVSDSSMAMVLMVKARFGDLIIRRTTDSLNFEGHPISMLPQYVEIMGYIELRKDEMDVLWGISNSETERWISTTHHPGLKLIAVFELDVWIRRMHLPAE
jgi:hypothetical protein